MDTLTSFLIGILSSLAAVGLLKYKLIYNILPKVTKKGYLIDLEKKIRQMPFIYKDLDTDVINDFVDVEFQSLDLGTLQLKTASKTLIMNEDEKLKRNLKVLFLGSAGIGKTTFQRRTILTIINNKSGSRILYGREKPIPVYIPLKAIDNSEPFPIYRYLRDNNPLFANQFGLFRLTRFAKARLLFLFIDGYDEIPFTGGTQNFVQEELGLILGLVKAEKNSHYEAFANCRVWLSSRKEFFEKNPIANLASKSHTRKEGIVGIELKGIGNNRIKLVRKIFDKYRKRSKENYEFLNEEYLLFEIDNSDDEIQNLSYNPLFLTVMCYIYAQKAVDEKNHKVEWARKFDELILKCIELLLNDLDENKARDLPKAHKEALLTRRNLFIEEKKLFLQYFSIQLYFDDKPVFTMLYLKQHLREFFKVEFKSTTILQDLDNDKASKPNIALQLIYQGVFVLVDTSRDEVFYDFPHRRFREVLASKYVNTPAKYERLLANAEGKQFGEFLTVFFKSESYSNLNFHDETLMLILDKALGHVSNDSFVGITLQFIKLKPSHYNPSKIVARFLTDAVLSGKQFRVSIELLKNYEPDHEFISKIRSELMNSTKTLNYERFYVCAAILSFIEPLSIIDLLKPLINTFFCDRKILPIIFQYLSFLDVNNISTYIQIIDKFYLDCYTVLINTFLQDRDVLPIIFQHLSFPNINSIPSFARTIDIDDEAYLDFCYAVSFNLNKDDYWLEFIDGTGSNFLKPLDVRRLIIFFYFIYKYCPNRYDALQYKVNFSIKRELFEYVEYHHAEGSVDNTRIDDICILSRSTIDRLIHLLENRDTAFLLNKVIEFKEWDKGTGRIENKKETRYAAIPITNDFKKNLTNSLKGIEFKVIDRNKLETFISNSINKPITKLIPANPKYIKFADLPEYIRSPKASNWRDVTQDDTHSPKASDWRDVTQDRFRLQLQTILKKDIFHKYNDIKYVSEIIEEIRYEPVQLVNHFQ